MKHTLISDVSSDQDVKYEISVLEHDSKLVNISIERTDFTQEQYCNEICINLNKEELHSFIGVLLHVQSKMKGGK